MKYNLYVIETVAFGVVAIASIVLGIYFLIHDLYFLSFLCILAFYVSVDNFFCSRRAKKCGIAVRGHYIMPPSLQK